MRPSFAHYCGSLLVVSSCHMNATHFIPCSTPRTHLFSVLIVSQQMSSWFEVRGNATNRCNKALYMTGRLEGAHDFLSYSGWLV